MKGYRVKSTGGRLPILTHDQIDQMATRLRAAMMEYQEHQLTDSTLDQTGAEFAVRLLYGDLIVLAGGRVEQIEGA